MKTPSQKGRDYEKNVAKDWQGRLQPGSGAAWHSKGDVKTDSFLVEAKYTEKESYSLRLKDITYIDHNARQVGKHWVMQLNISGKEVLVVDKGWIDVLINNAGA